MNNWIALCRWCKDSFDWDEDRVYLWLLRAEAETIYDMDMGDMMEALKDGLQFSLNDAKVWVMEHDNLRELFTYIQNDQIHTGTRQ